MNEGAGVVPYDGRFYNYNPVNYIQTPYEKTNVFGSMRMDLTDDIEFKRTLYERPYFISGVGAAANCQLADPSTKELGTQRS